MNRFRTGFSLLSVALCLLAFASGAAAQGRRSSTIGDLGGKLNDLIDIDVSDVTLEAIDFRDQTARLSVGLDITNPYIPVKLKDFDYRLSLFDQTTIEGRHDGTMKLGGRNGAHINLPVTIHLRSIPGVLWNAFSNRGNVRYQLDTGFSVPLLFFNKRMDKSFAGEVPLKSLVDAASILRARNMGGGRGVRDLGGLGDILSGRW
jgi:hypothetical protein